MISKYNLIIIFLCLCSFIGGIWNIIYINDGYHWGYIFSQSIDHLNGKTPYKDIFVEYGILQLLFNSFIIKIFGPKVIYIQVLTNIFYTISLYYLSRIIFLITNDEKLALLGFSIVVIVYPWPDNPWPIFFSYFFSILFIYNYLKKSKKNYIFSGIYLCFAYLSFTVLYNFVIVFFFLILIFITIFEKYYLKNNNYNYKIIYCLVVFTIIFVIFLIYLINIGALSNWLKYQYWPFFIKEVLNSSFHELLKDYTNFIIFYSFKNIIFQPQWSIYSILFISNIILILFYLIKLFKKNITSFDKDILIINFFILSLNFISQTKSLVYITCSLSLCIIPFSILIHNLKNKENKLIASFVILFLSFYTIFNFDLNNSKYAEERFRNVKFFDNRKNTINDNSIEFFKFFRWDRGYWIFIKELNKNIKKINYKCNSIKGYNLTSDSFIYLLIDPSDSQIIPFYLDKTKYDFDKFLNKDSNKILQKKINKKKIVIITHKNNEKNLNFNSDYNFKKIILKNNKSINEEYRIFYPSKCLKN